jgi:hypothetical protein
MIPQNHPLDSLKTPYFIELNGDVHVPMYEKFETELAELRNKEDTKARARKLLLSYTNAGALKAIC